MSDFVKLISAAVDAEVRQAADERGQVGIGELVALLNVADPLKSVVAVVNDREFGVSADVYSYRGYYNQLSIEPGESATVATLALRLSDAIGETFTGYKGGDYTMSRNTPVWISGYGTASGWAVTGVDTSGEKAVLTIEHEEW